MSEPQIGQPRLFEPPAPDTLTLVDRFGVPPFSILDARSGYWQDRKRDWLDLGITGELGRERGLLGNLPHVEGEGLNTRILRSDQGRSAELEDRAIYGSDADLRQRWEGSAYPRGARLAVERELERAASEGDEVAQRLLDSSAGRGDRLLSGATPRAGYGGDYDLTRGENAWGGKGTSVFDPVLCELAYRWFCPPGGLVADPFAGGSVRGIVAAHLGRRYIGTDLSGQQLTANREQAEKIGAGYEWPHHPQWHCADARDLHHYVDPGTADLVFTCPPYYDLEVYSDDPSDLSAAPTYQAFREGYAACLESAAQALAKHRFFVIVVGEVRDRNTGRYVGLVPDTVFLCEEAGLSFYNEGILVTSVGSLPIRTSRLFGPGRKLGKSHQNVLVFVKGDWRAACKAHALDIDPTTLETLPPAEPGAAELDPYDTSTPAF